MADVVRQVTASDLLRQHGRMKTQRTSFDQTWQDISERILPRKAFFLKRQSDTKGVRLTEKIFDATPALALDRFASAAHSLVVPRNQVWQKYKASVEQLNKDIEVQRYFDQLTKAVFAARYASNFDNQVHECFYDLGAYATMCLYVGDTGKKLLYKSVPLWQVWFAENAFGVVDTATREYPLTARQAVQEFGVQSLPANIVAAATQTPDAEFWFVCIVKPTSDLDVNRLDFAGMPFASYEISLDSSKIVKQEGYRTFPYPVGRYSVTPGEIYGRGPGELILPDVKMLNEMNKTTMQAAQLKTLPPILAQRDGILDAIRMTPAAINYGGIDSSGRQLVKALELGGDIGIGLELMEQKRGVIVDAFWGKMYQVLLENPQMTATQAMLIAQQQGALLAPTASRIESEFLARVSERELDILHKAGVLPEPPPQLLEAGGGYSIEYDSPMSRARRAEEGVGILRSFEQLAPMAQATGSPQTVFKRVNWDVVSKTIFEVNGAPAAILYTDDEMVGINAQAAQANQAQQILAAAPVAASAAKDLASAGAIANSQPNQAVAA